MPDNFNLTTLVGSTLGELKLYGQGAGALPTGNAVVSDPSPSPAMNGTMHSSTTTCTTTLPY
ncbi:MAG: hypothetical protein ACLVJ6_02075 [Merdibacter sp.]